jgi:hypothetical protein
MGQSKYHPKGIFYPSEEMRLAGCSYSLQVSSKILQSQD